MKITELNIFVKGLNSELFCFVPEMEVGTNIVDVLRYAPARLKAKE